MIAAAKTARWDRAAAAHAYRRAGFGADGERLERAASGGIDAVVADLFGRMEEPEASLARVRPLLATEKVEHLRSWWMSLILADEAPLLERLVLMWHNHFATSFEKVRDVRLMHRQNELFRRLGAGDFRELLHAVAKDPAMLVWLDGDDNRRGAPNENFAREVMELFGLGIGHYTERDVKEAARAFTGWGTKGRAFAYRDAHHDPGVKDVLGTEGALKGEDVIDLILAHKACARHVARRLLREFVSAEPDEPDVEETAQVLVQEEWHVARTLERLLQSELFAAPGTRRNRISSPVEVVAGTAITLGVKIAPKRAADAAAQMGQILFSPPSVKGWDGGRAWINAGTWLARHNLLRELAADRGLRDAFGETGSTSDVPRAVLALLLPDLADAEYEATLLAAAGQCADVDEALREVTALVLTSPEYHRA